MKKIILTSKTHQLCIELNYFQIIEKRIGSIDEQIRAIALSMQISQEVIEKIKIKIDNRFDLISPEVEKKQESYIIQLPPLFLIEKEDIAHDPEFFHHLYTFLHSENEILLKTFLEFNSNPSMANLGRTFALSHEIAHIALQHLGNNRSQNEEESCLNEKMADLYAAKIIEGAREGGLYLFHILKKHFTNKSDKNHPTYEERINYLDLNPFQRQNLIL